LSLRGFPKGSRGNLFSKVNLKSILKKDRDCEPDR